MITLKLSLSIADSDEAYVEALGTYIADNRKNEFQLNCFTRIDSLIKNLESNQEEIDILLINPQIMTDLIPNEKVKCLILLTEGRIDEKLKVYPVVDKYQFGDELISHIMEIFCQESKDVILVNGNNKNTRVIGVYAPVGGSGKTCIASACAINCSEKRQKVLYLNFEDIQSTLLLFRTQTSKNLSHVFYYLKTNDSNFDIKLQSIKQIDFDTGVHFFMPPESILEYEEIGPQDIKTLVSKIKETGIYDTVFIDMSCSFNMRNIALLEACDRIMLIFTQDYFAGIKMETLLREMDIAFRKIGADLRGKLIYVLNKYKPDADSYIDNVEWLNSSVEIKIPFDPTVVQFDEDRVLVNQNNKFGEGINSLLKKLI